MPCRLRKFPTRSSRRRWPPRTGGIFDHFGIDLLGTARAIVEDARANGAIQGGSSITQQLAKNLFLSSERSMARKIKEVYLALWLETHLTKREILKLYLDRAYLGGGNFGVEAASQFYFGKSVRDINMAEAAILAGLFKAPTKYAPHSNPAESRARTNQVLTNLVEAGFMTEGQVHSARLNPAKIIDHEEDYAPNYFLDWAYEEVQRLMRGKGEFVLTARTTVDVPLQKVAEQAIETQLDTQGRAQRASQAALVSMDTDGAVRAMVGGQDYGDSQFNRAVSWRPAAGLVVQALCLSDGHRKRHQTDQGDAGRLANLRKLVAGELWRRERRRLR